MAQLEKARIFAADSGEAYRFYVQFNPNEITITENVGENSGKNTHDQNAGNAPGAGKPQASPFVNDAEASFSTKLFFNTYESDRSHTDVRAQIKQFYYFFNPGSKSTTSKKIGFAWGSLIITGVLSSMQVSYSMFAANGDPVRAEVSITIAGDYSDRQSNEIGNAAFVERKDKGQGLMSMISNYSDPTGWRELLPMSANPLPETTSGQYS